MGTQKTHYSVLFISVCVRSIKNCGSTSKSFHYKTIFSNIQELNIVVVVTLFQIGGHPQNKHLHKSSFYKLVYKRSVKIYFQVQILAYSIGFYFINQLQVHRNTSYHRVSYKVLINSKCFKEISALCRLINVSCL